MKARATCGLGALLAFLGASTLSLYFPLGGIAAFLLTLGGCAVVFFYPVASVLAVPGLLPLIGWAPWSGWVTFEELDILVLACAAGGYARLAISPFPDAAQIYVAEEKTNLKTKKLGWLLVFLLAGTTAIAIVRGVADGGGWDFGWYQGYMQPMNSVRVAKALFLALILLPLWRFVGLPTWWSWGMVFGLCAEAVATVWERIANTGLLNFATDYRTTGTFWEMNVGGAALDGYLALTLPFALLQVLTERRSVYQGIAGGVLALGLYACLTTFSRGVYLAVPVGAAVTMYLHFRQTRRLMVASENPTASGGARDIWMGIGVVGAFAAAAAWIFPTSGYRGAFSLLGAVLALLMLAHWVRRIRSAAWYGGTGIALCMALLMVIVFIFQPKASYIMFGIGFASCLLAVYWARQRSLKLLARGSRRKRSSRAAAFGIVSFCVTVVGSLMVMFHWGEVPGLIVGLPVAVALLGGLAVFGTAKKQIVPNSIRWQAMVSGGMLMALTVVGVFTGGDYIAGRFSTGGEDFARRLEHWQQGLDMLSGDSELLLGRGMGRYPASYFTGGPAKERVGDYRLVSDPTGAFVAMSGGQHPLTDGQLLRVSQRIDVPQGQTVLSVDVKADKETGLRFEVCPKHLLYSDYTCLGGSLTAKAQSKTWQHFDLPFTGPQPSRGDWYAPKFIVFSMAVADSGHVVAVDSLHLRDAGGRDLLQNGDFSDGLTHWFMSSDHNHLPWHIKNMLMNIVFDQGILSLAIFIAMCSLAVWNTSVGAACNHVLAPSIAGGIAGFFVVGLFDSLLDVPRVAFIFYFMVLLALSINGSGRMPAKSAWARPATEKGLPRLSRVAVAT